MPIEVEIRSFITKAQYEHLEKIFQSQGKFLKEDIQETVYFDAPIDLRVQKNSRGTKIWLKKGKMHDQMREEFELWLETKDYKKALSLFQLLGYSISVAWWRRRKSFVWRDVTVALDYTRKYGYILELEKCVTRNKEKALSHIEALFQELNILPTPKEQFDRLYMNYVRTWQQQMKNKKLTAAQ